MVLSIYTGTENKILRQKSKSVKQITKKHLKLIKNMKETLVEANGLGLAAPQVGVGERIILANFQYGKKVGDKFAIVPLINPVIIDHSDEEELGEEGCLSLPEVFGKVKRYRDIVVKFQNEKGA